MPASQAERQKARLAPCLKLFRQEVLFAALKRCATQRLFFLVFVLDWFYAAIVLGLRFGVFHGLLGFRGLLGAGFGSLFALFVEHLFAAQQFEERFVGAVAFIPRRRG